MAVAISMRLAALLGAPAEAHPAQHPDRDADAIMQRQRRPGLFISLKRRCIAKVAAARITGQICGLSLC